MANLDELLKAKISAQEVVDKQTTVLSNLEAKQREASRYLNVVVTSMRGQVPDSTYSALYKEAKNALDSATHQVNYQKSKLNGLKNLLTTANNNYFYGVVEFNNSPKGDLDGDGYTNDVDYYDNDPNRHSRPVAGPAPAPSPDPEPDAPAVSLTEQELAEFTKKYNGWVAEAAGGNPENLKLWMNKAQHPLPDDYYKPINGFIFVRGDGPKDKPPTELKGNGTAVFAVDKDGNMFHVTSAVYQQMKDAGQEPKIHDGSQAVIDLMGVDGVMTSPTVATLYTPTTPAPTPDPVVPPIVVSPTTPAPADPGNSGSTTPAPAPDNGNNSNGGAALTTYTRNANDSGFAYPWSAAQSTGTTDVMGTIGKAVAFMNEHEGKNYKYDNVKGTIQAEDGSFISKDDVQALNNIIVTYQKQNFEGVAVPASVTTQSTAASAAGGVQAQTEQMRTIGGARIQDPNKQYGAPGDTTVGTMPPVINPNNKSGIPPIGGM